jgi:alkyl sulfatase BDS1-like metallo-beta-lactamase superfamily hydrolase
MAALAANAQPPLPPEGQPTEATARANEAAAGRLPLEDGQDFADARAGLLAQLDRDIVNPDGSIAWSVDEFAFLEGPPPATVNPSLWRQSRLAAIHGLFEIVPGLYQLRGYDLSVMTLIAGETGWIVIDPLTTPAPARAGLELANRTLGERPVSAIIYTHSHADHFGGVRGVLTPAQIESGAVPIYAPHGFLAEASGENVLAGTTMSRRAQYQFGTALPSDPAGVVGVGLGPKLSTGPIGLVPPTVEIPQDGATVTIDGIVFEFADAGHTEAPAEFVFYLPQFDALHTAEIATRTFHNVLTPRGALVRDALRWSEAIDTMLARYGGRAEIMLASHHWPIRGPERIVEALRNQRDMYRFTHDQTLRLAAAGLTMDEIANTIGAPDFAQVDLGTRGYYGTYEHNARAVYQRYFGWWNAVPADLHPLPKVEEAARLVAAMGGAEQVLDLARAAFGEGDYRWAASLLQRLVFAEPEGEEAPRWLAAAYEQLGFQAEAGTWRNIYLSAAKELRDGGNTGNLATTTPELLAAIPTPDLFDALAVRFDPARMRGEDALIQFTFPDRGEAITVDLRQSVLFPRTGRHGAADAVLSIERPAFDALLAQRVTLPQLVGAGRAAITGDAAVLARMFAALEPPSGNFPIVTP